MDDFYLIDKKLTVRVAPLKSKAAYSLYKVYVYQKKM